MKIIDFERKGNIVRFYLGADDLKEWWGDDWNDRPYEHNAGTVYDEYVSGHRDIAFDFDDKVCEPCDGEYNSPYCKEDFIARKVPCICVLKKEDFGEHEEWHYTFREVLGREKAIRYYYGDKMEPN